MHSFLKPDKTRKLRFCFKETLTQSPCHYNLALVKVIQIFIPIHFSIIQHLAYEN